MVTPELQHRKTVVFFNEVSDQIRRLCSDSSTGLTTRLEADRHRPPGAVASGLLVLLREIH